MSRLSEVWRRLRSGKSELLALVAIMAVGLALRLANISSEPYWGDEVLSLDIVRTFASAGELTRYLAAVEFHPPLYYLILRVWTDWFGVAEAATRALSVIFGLGVIAVVFALAKRLFHDSRVALLAAAVTAALPMQIEFSQEARPYAIYCFFAGVSAYCVWEFIRTRRFGFAVGYIAASTVGIYLHYSFLFWLVATALWWLFAALSRDRSVTRSRRFCEWLAVHGAIFVAFYCWVDAFLYKLMLAGFEPFGLPHRYAQGRPAIFIEAILARSVWLTSDLTTKQIVIFGAFVAKAALLAAAAYWLTRVAQHRQEVRPMLFLGWLALAPTLLFLFSPQSVEYAPLFDRHIIFITIPIAIIVARLVMAAGSARRSVAVATIFFVSLLPFVLPVLGNDAEWNHYFSLKSVGEYINENYRPGDAVIINYVFARTDLNHYLRPELSAMGLLPTQVYDKDVWNTRSTLGIVENEAQIRGKKPDAIEIGDKLERLVEKLHQPERVWLSGFEDDDNFVHGWFAERGWRRAFRSIEDSFLLDLYVRPR